MNTIPSGYDCFICGDEMVVHSDAPQECPCKTEMGYETCDHKAEWWAYDGDKVTCLGCNAEGWVSLDDEDASVNYDEMSEHNTKCYERYEKGSGNVKKTP